MANIDLPVPGGPFIIRLCRPMARHNAGAIEVGIKNHVVEVAGDGEKIFSRVAKLLIDNVSPSP